MAKRIRALIILLVLVTAAVLVWRFVLRTAPVPKEVVPVSGRVEGDDAIVASKTAGRIREIRVREGDTVKAGDVIAVLDDEQAKSRVDQARASLQQAEARLTRSQQQIGVLTAQATQSRLGINQAQLDANGRVAQAQAQVVATEAQVASAEAQLAQAEASYNLARWDGERFEKLAQQGDVSERLGKQAATALATQAAVVTAARKQVEAARSQVNVARAGLLAAKGSLANPGIRTAQTSAADQQILQAQSDVHAAQDDFQRVTAQLREAEANQRDLSVTAPFDGTVATRAAEPGEVVAPGTPIVTLVNLKLIYLRAFMPEGEIGRVKLGQKARVYLDSDTTHPLEATVIRIDPQAQFTPENTYFRDERVKQVFGLKLQITDPQGAAKPGMPADGEILVEGDRWPADTGHR